MLVREKEFELELPATWRTIDNRDAFEWQGPEGSQIIISTYSSTATRGDAQPVELLDKLIELRRQAHRQLPPTHR